MESKWSNLSISYMSNMAYLEPSLFSNICLSSSQARIIPRCSQGERDFLPFGRRFSFCVESDNAEIKKSSYFRLPSSDAWRANLSKASATRTNICYTPNFRDLKATETIFAKIALHFIYTPNAAFPFSCMQRKGHTTTVDLKSELYQGVYYPEH